MRRLIGACILAVGAMAGFAGQAMAQAAAGVELAGVKYTPGASVADTALKLNGAGVRYRFVVQVYTAGLYLASQADTPEALRDIDAGELGHLFTRGMQENAAKEDFSRSIPGTLRMADVFSTKKRLTKGESFSVDYMPGVGAHVLVNGKPTGETITEPEFFRALMGTWLGPNSADSGLKQALLGRAAIANNPRQRLSRPASRAGKAVKLSMTASGWALAAGSPWL